ncbi:MAG: glycerol kinase GlpK [Myxococcales bacterium]|nr:glycerol kinase GlpK [Myxococcales bacterium]
MGTYVLAIDQGTTGTTVVILNRALEVKAKGYREFPQIFPKPGWVEHDPDAIWASVTGAIRAALDSSGIGGHEIAAIGITNQRETTLVWERTTGRPVHNAIVWQCRRTADRCQSLTDAGHAPLFAQRTGLVLDAYFSGTKVAWILDHVAGARARAERGELAFGTVDSFLVNRLTGGAVHVTDVSNASRTLLLDLETQTWDPELCGLVGVPMAVLPEVRGSAETYGVTRSMADLPDGIPIAGMAGDQQAALFGQACFGVGDGKCTYGTGAFALVNTGTSAPRSRHGLLTTIAWRVGGVTSFALEGSAFIAGAAVQWLRDGLGLIHSASEIEALAASVPDSGEVIFVPALSGLGAPHWRPDARGAFFGITRGTTRAHFARAVLDGIAFEVADLLTAMKADLGADLGALRVDGGASQNDLLMQLQADALGAEIVRPTLIETTALGAAFLAGLGAGIWTSTEQIAAEWREDRRFRPSVLPEERAKRLARWHAAVSRA